MYLTTILREKNILICWGKEKRRKKTKFRFYLLKNNILENLSAIILESFSTINFVSICWKIMVSTSSSITLSVSSTTFGFIFLINANIVFRETRRYSCWCTCKQIFRKYLTIMLGYFKDIIHKNETLENLSAIILESFSTIILRIY